MPSKSNIKVLDFKHQMSAHCENGVTANLLNYYGLELSEAMVFGLGSGLFFSFLPFIKMNGTPVVAFRPLPGLIFKRATKNLGIKSKTKRYPYRQDVAMQTLDKMLEQGIPTAMVVGVYHLSYFPAAYRFHFNAHNVIAYGKKEGQYVVSDPVMETEEWITQSDLKLVRYAKGTYKPKGKMYWIDSVPEKIDLKRAIVRSIETTAKYMVVYPGQIIGVLGMRMLARHIRKWERKLDAKKAAKYLGSVVRMQEEIGTGGAGFRFLYAAFLQEAGRILDSDFLQEASAEMTRIGDLWREFATQSARVCKGRPQNGETYNSVADTLVEISNQEEALFKTILKNIKSLKQSIRE